MATIRILQIVGRMQRSGPQNWLMNVLRNIDRNRFRMDFLCHTKGPDDFDEEVRSYGSKIIVCNTPAWRPAHSRELTRIFREHGPYDVIHAHMSTYNGLVIRLAHRVGIPVRIAHSHNSRQQDGFVSPFRRSYHLLKRHWIWKYATKRLACSPDAAESLYGKEWKSDSKCEICLCAEDFEVFESLPERSFLKEKLGIDPKRKVVGHIGRFEAQKNHEFLVDVFGRMIGNGLSAHLLLVGEGSLKERVGNQIRTLGLSDRCTVLAARQDVPLLFGAMDLFLLPSFYEGAPLVSMESQATGVPILMTDCISKVVDVVPELIGRLDLDCGVEIWAKRAEWMMNEKIEVPRDEAMKLVVERFGIEACVERLSGIYQGSSGIDFGEDRKGRAA